MTGLNVASPAPSSGGHHVAPVGAALDQASIGGASATGNPYIDSLLQGSAWVGAITYSFPDTRDDYEATYAEADAAGFRQVSFSQIQAARYILEGSSPYVGGPKMGLTSVEAITNASLTDVGFNGADIRIAASSYANPTAYAYYPAAGNGYYAGDVWFGTSYNYSNAQVGNYQYATMLHELGHSLGLKHAQDGGGVSNASMPTDRDSLEFTVMTYRSYIGGPTTGYTNETYGYPQTYMMYDVAALQTIYGANFNTNAGNTIYTWSPTTGETFVNGIGQGVPGSGIGGSANRVFLTIWDGGGIDTYDLSNYSTNQSIDLSPGGWSLFSNVQQANLGDGNYARGNVFNALQYQGDTRSLIENVYVGVGNDTVQGNSANNLLRGGSGNDTLAGASGNDRLEGGLGIDTAVFQGRVQDYTFSRGSSGVQTVSDQMAGRDGVDTVLAIEYFVFSNGTYAASQLPSSQFLAPSLVLAKFSASDGWSSDDRYPRELADVNGDGRADIVGFGSKGVYVALGLTDGSFAAPTFALADFSVSQGWSSDDLYPRELADVNGDERADIVGFGDGGTYVVLGQADGSFSGSTFTPGKFSASDGWSSDDRYPRELADVNGDGRADIVGFGSKGVYVALGLTDGSFAAPTFTPGKFSASDGWSSDDRYPRELADVNGDGRADIVGFGSKGVYVALGLTDGSFAAPTFALADFSVSQGWSSDDLYPRELADVNGDERADIVGFGDGGTYVALSDWFQV